MSENHVSSELQRLTFDAWKFEIEAYWTRSSYFVVFELASATGIWKLFELHHLFTSLYLSLGATALTLIWAVSNMRQNDHIHYYWNQLEKTEPFDEFNDQRCKGYPGKYKYYLHAIPIIFFLGWLWLIIWDVASIFKLHICFS
jgi:hypothetical protein